MQVAGTPAEPTRESGRRVHDKAPSAVPQRCVLVVDDNQDYAENIAEILHDEGCDVTTAACPSEALALAERSHFHVALLDIKMPEMDGVELLAQLQAQRPLARYVMMTAFTKDERIEAALQLGAIDVLIKPIDLGRLIELVGGLPD